MVDPAPALMAVVVMRVPTNDDPAPIAPAPVTAQ